MTDIPTFDFTLPNRRQSQDVFDEAFQNLINRLPAWTVAANQLAAELNALADVTIYTDAVTYNQTGYTKPSTVYCSDGRTYRCVGDNVQGDNPVGSVTGNWVALVLAIRDLFDVVHNDIIGGDITVAGNILTILPCKCWNSERTVLLETTGSETCELPSVANSWFYVFQVKLVTDGTVEFRQYASKAAVESDTDVSAWRYISPWPTNSSAVAASAILKDGDLWFDEYGDTPIASGINPTSWTLLDLAAAGFPVSDFSHVIAPPANSADTEIIGYASVPSPGKASIAMRAGLGAWCVGNNSSMEFIPVVGDGIYIKALSSVATQNYALLAARLRR